MNGKSRLITLTTLLGILVLSFVLAPQAQATPLSEKKARLAQVQARLQEAYHKADVAAEKFNTAQSKLDAVQAQIRENARLLRIAEYNLAIANNQLQTRAERIYKARDVGLMDVLFSSNSFDELITQLDVMARLTQNDVDTVKAIDSYRSDIADRRVKLESDKKAAAELVKERAEQRRAIQAVEAELESTQSGLKGEIRRIEAAQRAAAARAAAATAAAAAAAQNGGGGGGTGPVVDPGGPGRPQVVAIAQQFLGVPYVYGGASPSGFDCSGLTMYCYAKIGIGLAHGATLQQKASTPVPISALQPGDLVFFGNAAFSSHVGIYVGGSTMIHAPHTGAVVSYGSMSSAWIGGRF